MNKVIIFIIGFLSLLLSLSQGLRAEEITTNPKNALALMDNLLSGHPELRLLESRKKEARAGVRSAGQRPNPELETKFTGGTGGAGGEISFQHTFETGGKRRLRKASAEGEYAVFQAGLQEKRQLIVRDLILKLHRLRQLSDEASAIKESTSVYGSAIAKLNRLPYLSPSLRAALEVYRLARRKNKLLLIEREREKSELLRSLEEISGLSPEVIFKLRPQGVGKWRTAFKVEGKAPVLERAKVRYSLARMRVKLEDSRRWPDLKVGPVVEYTGGREGESRGGISLSVNLPLFNRNQGARDVARAVQEREKLRLELLRRRIKTRKRNLLNTYNTARVALGSEAANQKRMRRRHAGFRRGLRRGLISPSLIVEFHRELADYAESRNKTELAALRAMLELMILNGQELNREVYRELL